MPLEPPAELPVPPPQPLKLTKRELKKLRTQRRQARESEKQDLIRYGLNLTHCCQSLCSAPSGWLKKLRTQRCQAHESEKQDRFCSMALHRVATLFVCCTCVSVYIFVCVCVRVCV